jgi:hypothetical protein
MTMAARTTWDADFTREVGGRMSPGPGAGESATPECTLEVQRTREVEIDVLIAHELAIGSEAAARLWEAAGVTPAPGPARPFYQEPFQGRTADVKVVAAGVEMFIEDKAAKGRFTAGQAQAYAKVSFGPHRSVLVAPQSFLDSHAEQVKLFTGAVSLEELAAALNGNPPTGADAETMLAASYHHRKEEFRRCAGPPDSGGTDPFAVAFGTAYKELALHRNNGLVQISPGSMTRERTTEIDFMAWTKDGSPAFQPYHKLDLGFVDFRVPGYSLQQLRLLLAAVPAGASPPKGWYPSRQTTKRSHSVLRFEVPKREGRPCFDEFSEVAEKALDALAELRRWWERDGDRLLHDSSNAALRSMVSRAAEVARLRGWGDQADRLSAVETALGDPAGPPMLQSSPT